MTIEPHMREEDLGIASALAAARERLLFDRETDGHWVGELSGSALSTATAITALAVVGAGGDPPAPAGSSGDADRIRRGLRWLNDNRNSDGGWGDTVLSNSNLSTTLLAYSAFAAVGGEAAPFHAAEAGARAWLVGDIGGVEPAHLARALTKAYGDDRSFSAPILTMAALSGRLGQRRSAWRHVPALPFELAAMPHGWLKRLRLPVVSYALPALIAIGQVRCHHRPPLNPLFRILRRLARGPALRKLEQIQPDGGGFLEAAPLTAFVVMSLAGAGRSGHPVVRRGLGFLRRSQRPDGSWPIDTDLSGWLTSLSVNALAASGSFPEAFAPEDRRAVREWLLAGQYRSEHPYTHAAPGGWAWTDLPGGVPDADDTAAALLAIRKLGPIDAEASEAARRGIRWLLDLQNRDGGVPTFCRGWGRLPFDRSSPDLTAHAISALAAWRDDLSAPLVREVDAAMVRMLGYLRDSRRPDGSWAPLWFGNQFAGDLSNPVYGTSRTLVGLARLHGRAGFADDLVAGGVRWLLEVQKPDGGFGGVPGAPSSIEETALAADALLKCMPVEPGDRRRQIAAAGLKAAGWLARRTDGGTRFDPAPIGLYFARLWYYERLYPVIFTVSALSRADALLAGRH